MIISNISKNIFSFTVCPAGSFINSGNGNTCELCPVNSYSTSIGSSSCQNCPTGTTTEGQRGQSSSAACGKGRI